MSTQGLEVVVELKDGSMIRLESESGNITLWLGYGLPDYTGSIDGFAKLYPAQLELAVNAKILKKVLK